MTLRLVPDPPDDDGADPYVDDTLIEPDRAYQLVDGQTPGPDPKPDDQRAPVVPTWMATAAARRAMAAQWVALAAWWAGYHGLRLPLYAVRLARRSPIGAYRIAVRLAAWCGDHRQDAEREQLAATIERTGNATLQQAALEEAQAHRQAVRLRWVLVLGTLAGVTFAAWWNWPYWTVVEQAGLVAAIVALLGLAGRDAHHPILSTAIYTGSRPMRPDPSVVVEALGALGIGPLTQAITKAPDNAVRFTGPAQRHGAGWRVDFDLPPGVTAGDVIDRRDRLAGNFRRPLSCVWPEADPDSHEARVSLYVADQPMAALGALAWVLADRGTVDLFDPVPIGVDQRGEPVTITLAYAAGVIGAVPRMGKTWVLRLLGLCAALDPSAELYCWDLKGTGDLRPLETVSTVNVAGDEPEQLAEMVAQFRALQRRMRARAATLRGLPRDMARESKVTRPLADRRDLDFRPIVVLVDECQLAFDDPIVGAEMSSIAEDLVRRGPALGIWAWFATQRPDNKSLPTGIRDNAVIRLALKVTAWQPNDAILGTGAYQAGIRATMFGRRDLGIALLVGEGDDPVIVKTAAVDAEEATAIAERGLEARIAAGWEIDLDEDQAPAPSFLDHLLAAWPTDQAKVSHQVMAGLLAELRPDIYSDITPEQVSSRGLGHGLTPVNNCKGLDGRWTLKGFSHQDIAQAITGGSEPPADPPAD